MTKLEDKVQEKNERWPLKERIIIGAVGAIIGDFSGQYVLHTLGVEDSTIRFFASIPFGFVMSYGGLQCDRITNYFYNK